jgi:hypothetical protein
MNNRPIFLIMMLIILSLVVNLQYSVSHRIFGENNLTNKSLNSSDLQKSNYTDSENRSITPLQVPADPADLSKLTQENSKSITEPNRTELNPTDKGSKEKTNTSANLMLNSLIPKSCSSTSNPCYGTDSDDIMTGDDGLNLMYGKKGNDELNGKEAGDEMYGEEGDDKLWGLGGDDTLVGAGGKDVLYGGYGNDVLNGGAESGIFEGGYGNDNIYGGSQADQIQGGPGADYIIAAEGNDVIWHGYGTAVEQADGSKDIIDCGPGVDWVWLNQNEDHDEAHDCEHINENPGDTDNDSISDVKDNCLDISNTNQADIDADGIGDACDPDQADNDHDFVPDNVDNCPGVSNNSQSDRDGDGKGDVCDTFPFNAKTSKVTVRFDSITVHNKHEGRFSGSGEWDLIAYVEGQRIKLTDATTNIVCGGNPPSSNCFELWFAGNGETYYFKQNNEITQDIPDTFPLSIFTVGSEVDGCGRGQFPQSIANLVTSDQQFDYGKITQIQKNYNNYANCGALFPETDNDVLGLLNKAYVIAPGSYQEKSNTGDFTLRYTVNVSPL